MSRALVALDALRELTDGTPADLAALLSDVVAACPIATEWKQIGAGTQMDLSRWRHHRSWNGSGLVASVSLYAGGWRAAVLEEEIGIYTTPEAAREACDGYLRARGWVLL